MNIPNAYRTLAAKIVAELGYGMRSIEALESGATSRVFRLSSSAGEYVLRIANPNTGKQAKYECDYAIRKALHAKQHRIAAPIATHRDIRIPGGSIVWALDAYVAGASPPRGAVPAPVSQQIGKILRDLHALASTGYGPLENRRDQFSGLQDNAPDGLLRRFEQPWPLGPLALEHHPAVRQIRALEKPLRALKAELLRFSTNGARAVIHADLHEQQVLASGSELTALIDFNEALVARPEFDFGSYLYFHGEQCLADLLDGYGVTSGQQNPVRLDARLAAILIALHHGNRSVILQRPQRLAKVVAFLQEQLLQ